MSGNIATISLISLVKLYLVMDGTVIFESNDVLDAAMSFDNSNVKYNGNLEILGNRGTNGRGMYAFMTKFYFRGTANFFNNTAATGGAMTLHSSVMYISSNATVEFNKNTAQDVGGAIYIYRPILTYPCFGLEYASCSIRMLPGTLDLFSINFNQNKAGVAGNAIYGGWTLACCPSENFCDFPFSNLYNYNGVNDSSDLSNFTSEPTTSMLL